MLILTPMRMKPTAVAVLTQICNKKTLHTMLLLLLFLPCVSAQQTVSEYEMLSSTHQREETIYMLNSIEYEHTMTHGSNIGTEIQIDYTPAWWLSVRGGFHVSTRNLYQLAAKGNFKVLTDGNHSLVLRNQYTYSAYADDNMQNFNMLLAAAYDQEYFYIAIGGYAQFFTGISKQAEINRSYIWEPGLVYDIEARIFKKRHVWNLGLQITNMREFLIERVYNPNFIMKGNYRFGGDGSENLNLTVKAGLQPSGIMHMTANYYSFYLNVGISCVI